MNHIQALQAVLDYIDDNIKNPITADMITAQSGYSAYYCSRIFTETIGIPMMSYVTWRRLQYALYDLSNGKKVIDVAMEYNFETHGGFTKAFVHSAFPLPIALNRKSALETKRQNTCKQIFRRQRNESAYY